MISIYNLILNASVHEEIKRHEVQIVATGLLRSNETLLLQALYYGLPFPVYVMASR